MSTENESIAARSTLTGLRVTMLLFGILFSGCSFLVGDWQFFKQHPADLSAAQNILAGVGAFLFALTLDVFWQLRQTFSNSSFRRFFGEQIERGNLCLVYPDFVLKSRIIAPCGGDPEAVLL
jgi:hypothetical protein